MDAPQAARLAGFFDLRRIKQAQPLIGGLNSQAPFLKERAAKSVEPVFALAKPLKRAPPPIVQPVGLAWLGQLFPASKSRSPHAASARGVNFLLTCLVVDLSMHR